MNHAETPHFKGPGRSIVGVGEALLLSERGAERAGGLAATVAIHAARLGYPGVVISRLGQDPAGEQMLALLRQAGADVRHLQTDPDLPTGRLTIRTLGGRTTRTLESRAAFDNLQWDFDLEDVGRQCDAVIFGELARREGQTRTTIDRFLAGCRHAMRIYDLTNRDGDLLERVLITRALQFAEGVVLDEFALRMLRPASGDEPREVVISSLARQHKLEFVLFVDDSGRLRSYAGESAAVAEATIDRAMNEAALVALVHGLLSGRDWKQSLNGAAAYSRFAAENPDAEIPAEMFE